MSSLTHGKFVDAHVNYGKSFYFFGTLWSLRISSNQHSSFSMATHISAPETKRGLNDAKRQRIQWPHKHRAVSIVLKSRKGNFLCNEAPKHLQTYSCVTDPVGLNRVPQDGNGERTGLCRDEHPRPPWLPSSEWIVPFRIYSLPGALRVIELSGSRDK